MAVVAVGAGTVTRISSEFDIVGDAIDDTTLYASSANGALTVELATAEAKPLAEGTLTVDQAVGDAAVLRPTDLSEPSIATPDALIVARRG